MRAPGKKVGTLRVRLERKNSRYDYASIEVELRLDVSAGTFHAQYDGAWHDAPTKDELSAKIRQAAQKTIDVEWSRYLVVDYTARAWPLDGDSGRPEASGRNETLSIEDDRAALAREPQADRWGDRYRTHVITSIDLHWAVCEFSTPYALPEDKKKTVRMRREIDVQLGDRDDEGSETYREVAGEPIEQDDDRLPVGAVPWTAEREALLREVLAALGELDARMVELFRGDPDQLSRRLDAVVQGGPLRLLEAPAPASTAIDELNDEGAPSSSRPSGSLLGPPRSRGRTTRSNP